MTPERGVDWLADVTISLPPRNSLEDTGIGAVAARAWSAHESVRTGPWLLRASGGFNRSANSVGLLGTCLPTEQSALIAQAESFYAAHRMPARFQIDDGDRHLALSAELLERGYRYDEAGDATTVVAPLRTLRSVAPPERDGRVVIAEAPTDDWIEVWWSTLGLASFEERDRTAAAELLWDLDGRCGFAAHITEGQLVATGLAVIEGPWLGMFCVGARPDRRRRGSGRRIVGALATWGIAHAATTAYASVDDDNAIGRQLFDRLGFTPTFTTRFLQKNV